MINAWNLAKEGNPALREAEQILDVIADDARVLVSQAEQSGLDRRWLRALKKQGKQDAEIARELAVLLKSFQEWLASVERSPQTRAGLRQEFEDFLTVAREREHARFNPGEVSGKHVADTRGRVGAAVRLSDPRPGLGQVMGRNLDDTLKQYIGLLKEAGLAGSSLEAAAAQAERILAGFLKAWESRRPAQEIEKIMGRFATEQETVRQKILALRADNKVKQADVLRREIVERGRDVFASTRKSVLREVLNDTQLREELLSVGLVVDDTGSTISFELDLGPPQLPPQSPGGATVSAAPAPNLKIKLNIDHATTDFADAIDTWIRTGTTSALDPVIAGSNMRIATGLENQVFFNYLKKDAQLWEKSVPTTTTVMDWQGVLQPTAREARVEDAVNKIESLLGQSLSAEERTLIRDYVDMAMQLSKP